MIFYKEFRYENLLKTGFYYADLYVGISMDLDYPPE
jgi:hypothetical protein